MWYLVADYDSTGKLTGSHVIEDKDLPELCRGYSEIRTWIFQKPEKGFKIILGAFDKSDLPVQHSIYIALAAVIGSAAAGLEPVIAKNQNPGRSEFFGNPILTMSEKLDALSYCIKNNAPEDVLGHLFDLVHHFSDEMKMSFSQICNYYGNPNHRTPIKEDAHDDQN